MPLSDVERSRITDTSEFFCLLCRGANVRGLHSLVRTLLLRRFDMAASKDGPISCIQEVVVYSRHVEPGYHSNPSSLPDCPAFSPTLVQIIVF
jgi:hypothetical protein